MHHMQRLIEIPNALRQVIEPLRLAPSTFYPTLAYCADCRRFSRGADFKAPLPINASVLNAAWLIAFSTEATFAGLGLSESISISFRAESSVAAKKDGVLTLFCHWKPRNRNRGRGGTLIVQLVPDLRNVFEHWCIPDPGAALGAEVPNREAVLTGYDGRGTEAIEERLWMESARIDVDQGRLVLAIRALVVRQAV